LGLATGTTPITLYEEMTKSDLDFTDKITINLDEHIGLPASHPASYHQFMEKHLFSKKIICRMI
jgi:glucosamine-6-phosphate deaminase